MQIESSEGCAIRWSPRCHLFPTLAQGIATKKYSVTKDGDDDLPIAMQDQPHDAGEQRRWVTTSRYLKIRVVGYESYPPKSHGESWMLGRKE